MRKAALAACLFALCGPAEAQQAQQVIIGNSVSPPYQAGTNFGPKSIGFHVESSPLFLEDIQVVLEGELVGDVGASITFTLNADNNGMPADTPIATIGSQVVTFSLAAPRSYTITPPAPLILDRNTAYWIQAEFHDDPDTHGTVNWNQPYPAIKPTSPSELATFVRYDLNFDLNLTPSATWNAIVVRGRVAPPSSGTAARAFLTGSRYGQPISPSDNLDGHFDKDTFSTNVFVEHVGWSGAGGILPVTGPRVGSYVSTLNIPTSGVGTGGARGIAFAQYRNDTSGPLTVPAVATLDGEFPYGAGHATAAVYVFDYTEFLSAINQSGKTMPQFLLGADTLSAYRIADPVALSVTRLFPATAALGDAFVNVDLSTTIPVTVGPIAVTVAAGQSVFVVFDVSAYAPPGSTVQFAKTLKPAAGFMGGLTPVGPRTPEPSPAANLIVAPAATTNAITTPVIVTAAATTSAGLPVPNTLVFFEITAGPNMQPLGPVMTDAAGRASFSYPGGASGGTDDVQASIGTLKSNVAQITWTAPGPFDHIDISPASATIPAGASQSYTALASDVFSNSIGDVTGATSFTISPDGSCTAATCTATVSGVHTVTAVHNGGTRATATLDVIRVTSGYTFNGFFDPIEMSTLNLVVWNTVKAGQAVPIRWSLTLNGGPVSDPKSFSGVSSYPVVCSSGAGSIDDAIEEPAVGASGLQYKDGGNWQFNWETLKSYKNSCRAVVVKFSDGTTSPPAMFKFK